MQAFLQSLHHTETRQKWGLLLIALLGLLGLYNQTASKVNLPPHRPLDSPAPEVLSITRLDATPTDASRVAFSIIFSQAVSGVDAGDLIPTSKNIREFSIFEVKGAGDTYIITVATGLGNGLLGLDLLDDDSIRNQAGKPLGGAGTGNGNYLQGEVYALNRGEVPSHPPADFDGNGTTDLSIYRPSSGFWHIKDEFEIKWGGEEGDIPVPCDYDGDKSWDVAVYRPATGFWYVNGLFVRKWGGKIGDIPVPADYDGDGACDLAVYRPSSGFWYIEEQGVIKWGGEADDLPIPADYDGDGKWDIAFYRPSGHQWYVKDFFIVKWGREEGDMPVPGDYDGDGVFDVAIYHPSTGVWQVKDQFTTEWGGGEGAFPVSGDYDGDGAWDLALFNAETGEWLIKGQRAIKYGRSGDMPVWNFNLMDKLAPAKEEIPTSAHSRFESIPLAR